MKNQSLNVKKWIKLQVGEQVVTIEDLTSDEANADYQRILTEKRGAALDDSFKDIEKLRDNVDSLQEENEICREMLNQSRNLVEVLTDILNEEEEMSDDGKEKLDDDKEKSDDDEETQTEDTATNKSWFIFSYELFMWILLPLRFITTYSFMLLIKCK